MLKNDWKKHLKDEISKEYFTKLIYKIENEYDEKNIYPDYNDIFKAFNLTDFNDVKVVILGQDPYFNTGQANGLAFSVNDTCPIPKSLKNIFLELKNDLGIEYPLHGDLTTWAKQGVFLLNTLLTVEDGKPGSHKKLGWERFTDEVIIKLNQRESPIVYLLWGNEAKKKRQLINTKKHLVLTAPHPSPLSAYRGFFKCKHFSLTNLFLSKNNVDPIDWQV